MFNPDRFAAIADVHGNRWALEAVLEDIERRRIPDIVNLGDHLFGPLDPEGTADLLISRAFPSVSGNQDRELLEPAPPIALAPKHKAWLAALPFQLELPGILLFHGTPQADNVYLLDTVHREGVSPATTHEIRDRLAVPPAAPLLLCGHTHIPRVVAHDGALIVNPGSVGLQAYRDDAPFPHVMETGSPHARYAILERAGDSWRVDLLHIPYDWNSAAQRALDNARPDWAHRLRTGRAIPPPTAD